MKKGQLSIANLLNFVVIVMITAVMTMITNPIIADVLAAENNSMARMVLQVIVPFMWLAVIMTLMNMANPQRYIMG